MPIHHGGLRDDFARGGRVGTTNHRTSDTSSDQPADQVEVQFQSVLRLRPLSRKEKEDHVVLEGVPASGKDSIATAVLHPFVSEDAAVTGSSLTPRVVQRGIETEFHFNHLLPSTADQDKAYYMIGLPMALAAMEPLKAKHSNSAGDLNNNNPSKTHLVVCMGTSNAGKTYTAFGKSISKRRNADDGLVPRILDSLFSQSKHHMSSAKNNNQGEFAVRITLLHVDASSSSTSTSPDDAPIRDLLHQETAPSSANPVRSRSPSPIRQRSIQSVKAMIANFEHSGSDGGSSEPGAVRIEQDETTKDFRVLNATVQTCRDLAEAREVLQQGLGRKKRGPFGKTIKGHTLVTLQPVLLEPKNAAGAVQQYGGMLAILDMASSKRKGSMNGRSAAPMKDNMAEHSTLAAVMHCLRTLQHNANVRAGRSPTIDIVNDDDVSVDASEISCVSDYKNEGYQTRQQHLKTVPYRQSKLTMLLQHFFSPRLLKTTFQTIVTIMFTAYPGHRDYSEKKSLLNDLELLHGISLTSSEREQNRPAPAVTGLNERERRPMSRHSDADADRMLGERSLSNDDDGDSVDYDPLPDAVATRDRDKRAPRLDHNVVEQHLHNQHNVITMPYHHKIPVPNAPPSTLMETDSLALSESMDDEDVLLPPPYAPVLATAPEHITKTLIHSDKTIAAPSLHASPPTHDRNFSSPPLSRTTPMDFPGVELPSTTKTMPAVAPASATPTRSRSRSPNRQVHFPNLYSSAIPTPTMLHQVAPTQAHPPSTSKSSSPQQVQSTNPTRYVTAEPQVITTKSSQQKSAKPKKVEPMEPRKEDKAKSAAIPWLANSTPMKSFNKVVNASRISGIKVLEKMTREASPAEPQQRKTSSRNQAASSPVVPCRRSSEFDVQDSATNEALMRKIQYLEDHNKDLMKELGEIATRCAKLEEEKNTLASQLREAHRRRLDSDWTALDEQEWQQSRKHRIDQQQLIRSPLQNHLQNVQSTFQMRNQWLEGGKPHFELSYPGNFRRATALDQRDRAAAAAATASEVKEGARAPPCTPLSSVKKRLSQDGLPNGSNRKRLQLFQQLLENEHRKRLRQGQDK